MSKQKVTQRTLQCCDCESEIAAAEKKIEIELFRYSRHGVGVTHVGLLCEACHGRMGVAMAAEA